MYPIINLTGGAGRQVVAGFLPVFRVKYLVARQMVHMGKTHLIPSPPGVPFSTWRDTGADVRPGPETLTVMARFLPISARSPAPPPAVCGGLKGVSLPSIIRAASRAGEGAAFPGFLRCRPQGMDREISPARAVIGRAIPGSGLGMNVFWRW